MRIGMLAEAQPELTYADIIKRLMEEARELELSAAPPVEAVE